MPYKIENKAGYNVSLLSGRACQDLVFIRGTGFFLFALIRIRCKKNYYPFNNKSR